MALQYHLAVDNITANKALKLQKYELDDDDWEIISDLVHVLKIYKDATLIFSQDSTATIAHIIPTMDHIDKILHEAGTMAFTPSVKHALTSACNILDKYYSKTDLLNVYQIEMGTFSGVNHDNPQLKLKYFQQHGWERDWIETAEEIVRDKFVKYDALDVKTAVVHAFGLVL
ncbi:hypothetical protein F5148DRAFT_986311 [Russula earlei]|uniref:Uncharacterized protein n=1 Tax=Russula earlei TaxID=71964 RepID=A0ACC0TWJ9_9AGAM|nr:hypothetical protein F5148DRAFT_986311 [Russula earlei]